MPELYEHYEDDEGDFVIDGSVEHNTEEVLQAVKSWLNSKPHLRSKFKEEPT